jgi:hypothetical protein
MPTIAHGHKVETFAIILHETSVVWKPGLHNSVNDVSERYPFLVLQCKLRVVWFTSQRFSAAAVSFHFKNQVLEWRLGHEHVAPRCTKSLEAFFVTVIQQLVADTQLIWESLIGFETDNGTDEELFEPWM